MAQRKPDTLEQRVAELERQVKAVTADLNDCWNRLSLPERITRKAGWPSAALKPGWPLPPAKAGAKGSG